jgi:MerR family transcriptional regulator/heat shock protein HspR
MYEEGEPIYVISVVARMLDTHPQTLRYYERLGLIQPSRSQGRIRLYSARDIARLQLIQRLVGDLGVNLAGAEVIINLTERMVELERQIEETRQLLHAERERVRRQSGHRD